MRKEYLYFESHTSKELFEQIKELFSSTVDDIPFNVEEYVVRPIMAVDFNGDWVKNNGTRWIGNIVFGDHDEIIVNDFTRNGMFERLVRRIVSRHAKIIVVFKREDLAKTRYKILKDRLIACLTVESHEQCTLSNGISKKEWRNLHYDAVMFGAYDIAQIAFKQLLIRSVGYPKARAIFDEHYQTYLKACPQTEVTDDDL